MKTKRELDMQSKIHSVEDYDEGPSIKVNIDGRYIRIEADSGEASLYLADFDQIAAELERYRRAVALIQGEAV